MSQSRFENWHHDLQDLLGLAVPPIGVAFMSHVPAEVGRIERTMPPATADGRDSAPNVTSIWPAIKSCSTRAPPR
jgi:hypothetical protein